MVRTQTGRRRRAVLATLATTLVLGLGLPQAPAAGAAEGFEAKLLRIVNTTRERHDLRALKLDASLSDQARAHTRRMIQRARIYDPPNLDEILAQYRWDDLGADVVGCGNTLKQLHDILMTEDFHRDIILHPDLRRVGIGVVRIDERNRCGRDSFWATEIFYG
jgi:uncharacterized protein YkwD